jgi:excisionase family DNA binding protein
MQPDKVTAFEKGRDPITVTVSEARRLTGLGNTTLYKLIKEKRLAVRRVKNVDRTLIDFASLRELLTPEPSETAGVPRRPRPRRRPEAAS